MLRDLPTTGVRSFSFIASRAAGKSREFAQLGGAAAPLRAASCWLQRASLPPAENRFDVLGDGLGLVWVTK
jgi:hypothetical protein